MNASAASVVVTSHVVDLTNIALGIELLDGWCWWWKLDENGIDFVLILSEKFTCVALKSWVLEVGTHFNDMCNSQGREVMSSPLLPPFLIFQSFSNLTFVISIGLHVPNQ